MFKRTYDIAFKKEVLAYIEVGHTTYEAARDHYPGWGKHRWRV